MIVTGTKVTNRCRFFGNRVYRYRSICICTFTLAIIVELVLCFNDNMATSPNKYGADGSKSIVSRDGTLPDSALSDLDDLFFEIVEPEDIKFSYRVRLARTFGSSFVETLANVALVAVQPFEACSGIRNGRQLRGRIALARRGDCSFLSKTINAENAGALAIIIADNDPTNENLVDMIGDDTERVATIPAVFLAWKDGYMIRASMDAATPANQVLINIPLNLTRKNQFAVLKKAPWSYW